jgi:ribonuclease BN (tRNA processing enzyme)
MPGYEADPRFRKLAADVKAIHQDLHNIEFFQRGATVRGNELRVLRRWNSHTPMLQFSYGGGYLLRWQGKGTVIDPGITFLDVFQRGHPVEGLTKPHHMEDIDLVVVTHDHADHCEDLGMLLVFLRNYNKEYEKTPGFVAHTIDLVQSIGAHFRSVILVDNAENRAFVRAIDVPPPRRKPASHRPLDLKPYNMQIEEFCTDHTEVLGDRSALGFRMKLYDGKNVVFVYCDTGDTRYNPELREQYHDADLLLLHVGTMQDEKGDGEHLCFGGVVEILKDLEQHGELHGRPKLVLLGEWGEEFRGPDYRRRFAELAKSVAGYNGPVLPADLGMRIQLDDRCRVMCRKGRINRWISPQDVDVIDCGQWIEYHAL